MDETFPVLYLLMRTDLSSMNPGKMAAQASHASNAFVHYLHDDINADDITPDIFGMFGKWSRETPQGFGTVLVLAVNETQMRAAVNLAQMFDLVSGIVHDPTYPILIPPELGQYITDNTLDDKGLVVGEHHNYVTIPLDTCAFVFSNKNNPALNAVVGSFSLHP